jgi:hypothetical protein
MESSKLDKKRNNIIQLIMKLKNVSTDKGYTETEMLHALEQIERLMAQYNIELSETEIRENKYNSDTVYNRKSIPTYISRLHAAIAHLFDCQAFFTESFNMVCGKKTKTNTNFNLFGSDLDVKLAKITFEMVLNNITMLYNQYKKSDEYKKTNKYYHGKLIHNSYMLGIITKISQKVAQIVKERENHYAENNSSTALITLKRTLVKEEFKTQIGKLRTHTEPNSAVIEDSYKRGINDGESISFNEAIENNGATFNQIE